MNTDLIGTRIEWDIFKEPPPDMKHNHRLRSRLVLDGSLSGVVRAIAPGGSEGRTLPRIRTIKPEWESIRQEMKGG